MAKPDIRKRLINQVFEQLENEYLKERKAECESLHNRIVEVIADEQASPQNTLLVLEMLKAETIEDCKKRFFNSEPQPDLSTKEPKSIGG